MDNHQLLIENINRIHTTELGHERIKKNLGIECNVIEFCKSMILNDKSEILKHGKNWYCINNEIVITINAQSYTIITAHKIKYKS